MMTIWASNATWHVETSQWHAVRTIWRKKVLFLNGALYEFCDNFVGNRLGMIADIDIARKLVSLETSAKSRNINFNISFNKLRELMEQERCYYTGVFLKLDGPNGRSIDRVDNSIGYVDDNIVACAAGFNNKKGSLSIQEISALYGKVSEFMQYLRYAKIHDLNPTI